MNKNKNKESFLESMIEGGKEAAGISFLLYGFFSLCGTVCTILSYILS